MTLTIPLWKLYLKKIFIQHSCLAKGKQQDSPEASTTVWRWCWLAQPAAVFTWWKKISCWPQPRQRGRGGRECRWPVSFYGMKSLNFLQVKEMKAQGGHFQYCWCPWVPTSEGASCLAESITSASLSGFHRPDKFWNIIPALLKTLIMKTSQQTKPAHWRPVYHRN